MEALGHGSERTLKGLTGFGLVLSDLGEGLREQYFRLDANYKAGIPFGLAILTTLIYKAGGMKQGYHWYHW